MELEKLASIFEACRVLPLRPSDMLVFRSMQNLNVEQMAMVHAYLEERTGHARILVLTDGADIAVLRPEEELESPAPVPPAARPKSGSAPGAIA